MHRMIQNHTPGEKEEIKREIERYECQCEINTERVLYTTHDDKRGIGGIIIIIYQINMTHFPSG